MDSYLNDIPRLRETKLKPQIGEIRLATDGQRRKIFDGKCWQYLCNGDSKCRIQSKTRCRLHRLTPPIIIKPKQQTFSKRSTPITGEVQTMPSGYRRIWKGERWHGLCRAENCLVQSKDFCKIHSNERKSLPTKKEENVSSNEYSPLRSRSLTTDSIHDKKEEQQSEIPSTSVVNCNLSPELSTVTCENKDSLETIDQCSPKQCTRRRRRRRRRSMNSIWTDISFDDKNQPLKRRSQRLNQSIDKFDNQSSIISTDTNEICSKIEQQNTKKRKTTNDSIHNQEHIVPKRKFYGQRRRRRQKRSKQSNTSITDMPIKTKSNDESALSDSDLSLRLKGNRFHTNNQSIEIPIQGSSSSPFSFDSSTSAIVEQFGTIIKKESIIEEESLICVSSLLTHRLDTNCETLQDFLRTEEIKNKEFQLDCQRISYRLAKIQDCLGNLSSQTT